MITFQNTCCLPSGEWEGRKLWAEWPLPFDAASLFDAHRDLPYDEEGHLALTAAEVGEYTLSRFKHRCTRWVVLEGAAHNGSTYTSLGTETCYGTRIEAHPAVDPVAKERPIWRRDGRDVPRFSQLPPPVTEKGFLQSAKTATGGMHDYPVGDYPYLSSYRDWTPEYPDPIPSAPPGGTSAEWRDRVLRPAARTFPLPAAASLFEAVIGGSLPSKMATTAATVENPSVGIYRPVYPTTPEFVDVGIYDRGAYNAAGVLVGSTPDREWPGFCRVSDDSTIYRITLHPGLLGGDPVFRAVLDEIVGAMPPAFQVTPPGLGISALLNCPIPPGIPHDILLVCTTFKKCDYTYEVYEQTYPEEVWDTWLTWGSGCGDPHPTLGYGATHTDETPTDYPADVADYSWRDEAGADGCDTLGGENWWSDEGVIKYYGYTVTLHTRYRTPNPTYHWRRKTASIVTGSHEEVAGAGAYELEGSMTPEEEALYGGYNFTVTPPETPVNGVLDRIEVSSRDLIVTLEDGSIYFTAWHYVFVVTDYTTGPIPPTVSNAGTLITPYAYYSRCEPRVYYAAP